MWPYISGIIKGFWTLFVGMKITVPYLGRRAITIQYPKQKMEMFEAFRGRLAMSRDRETNKEKCTGCQLCAKACASNAIAGKLKELHVIDHALCIKCGKCITSCTFGAVYKD